MGVLAGAEAFAADGLDDGRPAVLLCHGFTGTPQGLRGWADDLAADGLAVSLPRLPGHGTTWQQMARTSWSDWSAAVAAELAALRATGRRVVVGGLSMGGALALRLAADSPADVAGLVLVNPAVHLRDRRLPGVRVVAALHRRGLLGRSEPTGPALAGDVARPGVRELAYDRTPLAPLDSLLGGLADLRRDLPRVHAPLVVLRSATDAVVPASSSALVLTRTGSADAREEVLPRSRHVATLDHDAPRITAATLELVARVAASTAPAAAEARA